MLRGRTKASWDSARGEGLIGGRRPKLSSEQQAEVIRMVSKGCKTAAEPGRERVSEFPARRAPTGQRAGVDTDLLRIFPA
jgi:DNA invertase Pin-like site-specific DNA recombinase